MTDAINQTCNDSCVEGQDRETDMTSDTNRFKSRFLVPKMDCPSEERIIRMSLESLKPQVNLVFDTPNRALAVFHADNLDEVTSRLESLGFGATLVDTQKTDRNELYEVNALASESEQQESKVLQVLLAINLIMFFVELSVGWAAQSTGLIADSLDMFADAAVYGVALYAVGHTSRMKLRAAHLSGWLQMILAFGALSEVLRRFIFGSDPVSTLMMGIGGVALVANIACLMLISTKRDGGAHMQASWIFSANDVIANIGVILAGGLVLLTGSRYPDLLIGLIIGLIVLNGARRILNLKS